MSKLKIFSLAMIAITSVVNAQDLGPAKKAIDAEQYEKAKSTLKSIVNTNAKDGTAAFLLGKIYLKQAEQDSAKIFFNKALASTENARLGNIGLGEIDLNSGNASAAKAKFDQVSSGLKKKDFQEYIYIAQAYTNSDKPDYDAAIAILEKAKMANPKSAEVFLALGDAYYGKKDQNNAYPAYRSAYTMDNSMIRAKMQQGVLLKGAKSYVEANKAFDEVIKLDSNYGPVYRELAETYYLWAYNNPKDYNANIAKSLTYYEKYMGLTDYSLSSRMRHADFLILAQDYKALEVEANEMKKLDKVNPRILRYSGYSAYENGNNDNAIASLTDYINKGTNKVIGGDYYYLGLAQIKKSVNTDPKVMDKPLFDTGITNLKKGIEMSNGLANALNAKGKEYFANKQYNVAQALFEVAISNKEEKNYLEDGIYYALSVITSNRGKEGTALDTVSLDKADKVLDEIITRSPSYSESFLYKARINSALEKNDIMTANYQKYVDLTVAKGAEEVTKNKTKLTEAYNNMGGFYAVLDKVKAKEMFNKTLELDPTNEYATQNLKNLK
jgi:predicted Zn-dependent protease